jgi:ABC-type uncharacterized transport system permease subunit
MVGLPLKVWFPIAVALHLVYLVILSLRLGHIPIGDVYEVQTTFAWLSAAVYLFLEIRLKDVTMGVFFLPIVVILHTVSSLFLDVTRPLDPILTNVIFEVHAFALVFAYASFAISFITSLMYILLSKEMHSRKLGIFFDRLPPLDFIDKLSNQAVNIGLVLVTFGILLGGYLGMNVWEGRWFLDPKLLAVVASWGIYLAHFVTRRTIGWQGRRAAVLSVVGFSWLLFSFVIVSLFSTVHKFQ